MNRDKDAEDASDVCNPIFLVSMINLETLTSICRWTLIQMESKLGGFEAIGYFEH